MDPHEPTLHQDFVDLLEAFDAADRKSQLARLLLYVQRLPKGSGQSANPNLLDFGIGRSAPESVFRSERKSQLARLGQPQLSAT